MEKIKIFYSYCRKDSEAKEKLDIHLSQLKKNGVIDTWHDKEILAGAEWENEINQHLIEADIVLFLLSVDFLNSENCGKELEYAKEHKKRIIPIILNDCAWEAFKFEDGSKLNSLQAIPNNDKDLQPISRWGDSNKAWHTVHEELKKVCEEGSFVRNIKLTDDFEKSLNDCSTLKYSHSDRGILTLDDIFVWPEFEKSKDLDTSEYVSEESIFKDIDTLNRIWIVGRGQSGKTTLANRIFCKLREKGLIPVIFSHPYQGLFSNQLQKKISEQYVDLTDHNRYRDKIVPIMDDFHKYDHQDKLLLELEIYPKHILLTDKIFSFNFRDKNLRNIEGNYCRYEIVEFYATKRDELIRKWLAIGKTKENTNDYYKSVEERTRVINSTLGKVLSSGIVPSYPFFILTIISSYEAVHKQLDPNITSQGHCYQALIYQHFIKHSLSNEDIDSYLNFLDSLAYFFYKGDIKEISEQELKDFIEKDYKKRYNLYPKTDTLISKLDTMGILARNSLGEYSFRYKYFYYYFIAKYIADNLKNSLEEMESIFDHLHKDENAYIAIFMCHHSKDERILDHVWLNANLLFEKYEPATLTLDEVSFVDKRISGVVKVVLPSNNKPELVRQEELKKKDEQERNSANQLETDEETDDVLLIELRRCIKTAEVMGHIIRNRCGSLEKNRIKSIFRDAMNIHLRVLSSFFTSLREDKEQPLEEYLADRIQEQSQKRKHDLSRDEATKFAKQILAQSIFGVILAIMGKIVFSLGTDRLSDIVTEVCDEINTPASLLVKRGILMHYRKKLSVKEIDKESKDFSRTAKKIRNVMIAHHCYFHSIDYKDKQRIKQAFGIPIIPHPEKE